MKLYSHLRSINVKWKLFIFEFWFQIDMATCMKNMIWFLEFEVISQALRWKGKLQICNWKRNKIESFPTCTKSKTLLFSKFEFKKSWCPLCDWIRLLLLFKRTFDVHSKWLCLKYLSTKTNQKMSKPRPQIQIWLNFFMNKQCTVKEILKLNIMSQKPNSR